MIPYDTTVLRIKDVQEVFQCGESAAKKKMKHVRQVLGKNINNKGMKGAAPITMEQLKKVYGI